MGRCEMFVSCAVWLCLLLEEVKLLSIGRCRALLLISQAFPPHRLVEPRQYE